MGSHSRFFVYLLSISISMHYNIHTNNSEFKKTVQTHIKRTKKESSLKIQKSENSKKKYNLKNNKHIKRSISNNKQKDKKSSTSVSTGKQDSQNSNSKNNTYKTQYTDFYESLLGRSLHPCVDVKVQPYGYVRLDTFFDTRQVIASSQDQVVLFPAPRRYDKFGNDINATGQFNMTAFNSRIGIKLEAPDWQCFKLTGRIETDFRGRSDKTVGLLRLRHAYGKISWPTGEFLFGQYWHPLYIVECAPRTVNINKGRPFEARSRMPQLRAVYRDCCYEVLGVIASQSFDFSSPGPCGTSTKYIRNALVPNLHIQARYYTDYYFFGAALDYKRLVPRLATNKYIATSASVNSIITQVFFACAFDAFSLHTKIIYAQNGADHDLISGYAVETLDKKTDCRTYTPTAAFSTWADIAYFFCCNTMEVGLFVGAAKNLGASTSIFFNRKTNKPIIYSLAHVSKCVDYATRVSPRFVIVREPLRCGFELEWTRAAYGAITCTGKVARATPVDNVRIQASLFYYF